MRRTVIIGTGSYAPDNIISNDDIAKLVDTSDEWISSRTGIKERRISTKDTTTDMAYEAARAAIKNACVNPEDIDLIICATITPDYFMPSVACMVQGRLKVDGAAAFDLNAACTGFVYALVTASQFIQTGMYNKALVIGVDAISKILDWEDRSTCVLFGDGAGAAVLSASEDQDNKGIITSILSSDGSKHSILQCEALPISNPYSENQDSVKKKHLHTEELRSSHSGANSLFFQGFEMPLSGIMLDIVKDKSFTQEPEAQSLEDIDINKKSSVIRMEGQEVFKYAVRNVSELIKEVLYKADMRGEDISCIISHQANSRIIEAVAKNCNIPSSKFFMNLDRYGNTSSASIGIALDEVSRAGTLRKGDKVILVGFGGGMTSGAVVLEWS